MPQWGQRTLAVVEKLQPDDLPRHVEPPERVTLPLDANGLKVAPDSMGRPGAGGPWRRLIIMQPPGLSTETRLRNARVRSAPCTCIQTALSHARSNEGLERSTFSSAGNRSSIQ